MYIYEFEKEIIPGVILTLSCGYIHVHVYDLYSQTKLIGVYLRSQVSVYRAIGPLVLVLVLILIQNIDCGYSLEPPR